jgi:glycosyltransferase involved in cell wall biosynthesis
MSEWKLSPTPPADISAMPLVSVIIPAYNAENFVMRAIQSVFEQNYQPLEILLIDDGSTDGTAALVEREAPEIQIIRQANAGVAAARNAGLRHATGELICFLDADDGWFPGKLAAQVNYLQAHPEVGLVYHSWLVWKPDADGHYADPKQPSLTSADVIDSEKSGWIYHKLLLDCIVHTSTAMIRRPIAQTVGFFDTNLTNGEDYNYWLRVSRVCEIHKLKNVYSFYRQVAGSLTNTPKPRNFEYLVINQAIDQWGLSSPNGAALSDAQMNRRLARLAFDFGYNHFHHGSPALAKAAFRDVIKHWPLMWRAFPYLAASQLKVIF